MDDVFDVRQCLRICLAMILVGAWPLAAAAESWTLPAECSAADCLRIELLDEQPGVRPTRHAEFEAVEVTRRRDLPLLSATLSSRRKADETARALAKAATLDPDARVVLSVAVDVEIVSKEALLAGVTDTSDEDRLERVELIERETQEIMAPVEDALTSIGAEVLGRQWLGQPGVAIAISARDVPRVVGIDGVIGVSTPETGGEQTATPDTDYYSLGRVADHQGLMSRDIVNNGWDGNSQNRTDPNKPMRIGIIELQKTGKLNWIDPSHPGWLDQPGGATRLKKVMQCGDVQCVDAVPVAGGNHGMGVASVAAGSILQGQDPNFPGTSTGPQLLRTGQVPEAELYYYNIGASAWHVDAALQAAVSHGVDVVNMSFAFDECDALADPNAVNAAIRDAANAGVVMVAGAGNEQSGDTCMAHWPSTRPEVLAVTGTNTSVSATAFRDSSLTPGTDENGFPFASYVFGGMPATTRSGVGFTASVLALVAPGWVLHPYRWSDPQDGIYENGWAGSSLASPAVAGAATLLLAHFRDAGSASGSNARRFAAHMMLLGDAWDGADVVVPGGTQYMANGPNPKSGFGRLRMRAPYAPVTNLVGPYHWGSNVATVLPGSTYSFAINGAGPEPAGPTEFKVVAHWTPTDLNSTSDIVLELWNTCPAGGGAAVKLQHNWTYDYRKRIRRTNIAGNCLEVRVIPYSVPAQGETVYIAYLYHSGEVSP